MRGRKKREAKGRELEKTEWEGELKSRWESRTKRRRYGINDYADTYLHTFVHG